MRGLAVGAETLQAAESRIRDTDMAKEIVEPGTQLAKDLDQVLKAGHRAKELVRQILVFSRQSETEPIDPRAGHIPGARSLPLTANLAPDGRFLAPDQLRARFAGIDDAAAVISYCGSGITACHNLIALEHAGLGRGRLYPGSWSQYSSTDRPAAVGDEPVR